MALTVSVSTVFCSVSWATCCLAPVRSASMVAMVFFWLSIVAWRPSIVDCMSARVRLRLSDSPVNARRAAVDRYAAVGALLSSLREDVHRLLERPVPLGRLIRQLGAGLRRHVSVDVVV